MLDYALLLGLALAAAPCPVGPAAPEIIAHREGYYKAGTLPARYNNPGSLKFIAQPYALFGSHRFSIFTTPEAGWEALMADLDYKVAHRKPLGKAWRYMRKHDRMLREYYRQLDQGDIQWNQ